VSEALSEARLYFVSGARIAAGDVTPLIPELASAGVDVFQLREKEMEARAVMRAAEPIRAACRTAGIPFVLNDRPDVALALGADGVHLGREDLPLDVARRIVPGAFIGLSTHTTDEINQALTQAPDYLGVGPVHATPTKPGRPGTGIGLVEYAARHVGSTRPWFVTGGMNKETLPEVLDAGGRRVVVVRAIAEASDPVGAAAELAEALRTVPL
jgi:thiamine-phosphate pyrophosphorylase